MFPDWVDVSQQTSMTQFGPEHCARIDRIYCQAHRVPESFFRISSTVVAGFRELSDHVPVQVHIKHKKKQKSNRIPRSIINNPLFASKVEELWSSYQPKTASCWQKMNILKSYMHEACAYVRKYGKTPAEMVEYQLGLASSFHHAVVDNDIRRIESCVSKLPKLRTCYSISHGAACLSNDFFTVWAELASTASCDSSNDHVEPQHGQPRANGNISKTVASFPVASSSPLDAVWDSDEAKAVKDSLGKAKLLENHWSQVFSEKRVSQDSIKELLGEYRTSFPSHDWTLDRNHLKHILKHPKKSCPGPDGIPFHAFSAVPEISEMVLWDCANCLLAGGEPPLNFNWATLLFFFRRKHLSKRIVCDGTRRKIRGLCPSQTLITESLQICLGKSSLGTLPRFVVKSRKDF